MQENNDKNDKKAEIPLLTESEFNADIDKIMKNSLVEDLQLTIKEFTTQFVKIFLFILCNFQRKLKNSLTSKAVSL